jgi:hypothetical protein
MAVGVESVSTAVSCMGGFYSLADCYIVLPGAMVPAGWLASAVRDAAKGRAQICMCKSSE